MISLADYVIWLLITLAAAWLLIDAVRDMFATKEPWHNAGFVFMCLLQMGCGILVAIGSYGYALKMMEGVCRTVS